MKRNSNEKLQKSLKRKLFANKDFVFVTKIEFFVLLNPWDCLNIPPTCWVNLKVALDLIKATRVADGPFSSFRLVTSSRIMEMCSEKLVFVRQQNAPKGCEL